MARTFRRVEKTETKQKGKAFKKFVKRNRQQIKNMLNNHEIFESEKLFNEF